MDNQCPVISLDILVWKQPIKSNLKSQPDMQFVLMSNADHLFLWPTLWTKGMMHWPKDSSWKISNVDISWKYWDRTNGNHNNTPKSIVTPSHLPRIYVYMFNTCHHMCLCLSYILLPPDTSPRLWSTLQNLPQFSNSHDSKPSKHFLQFLHFQI